MPSRQRQVPWPCEVRCARRCSHKQPILYVEIAGVPYFHYLVSVAKHPFGAESSVNQSNHVRAGFSPCPAHLSKRSSLLPTQRLKNKRITLMKSAVSWLLSSGRGLKPALTCKFNRARATGRTMSFATETI
jgi:hypothetical protein